MAKKKIVGSLNRTVKNKFSISSETHLKEKMSLGLVSIFIINLEQQQYFGFCICASKCVYVCFTHAKPANMLLMVSVRTIRMGSETRLLLKNLSSLTGNTRERDRF